jgi:hypothetical protein
MKKCYLLASLFFLLVAIPALTTAQKSETVNQVLIGNGGKFETAPPYVDYVTMQKYDPSTHNTSIFNTIETQSVQDILIVGNFAYVAAQDSIVKYDINTYERVAAVSDSGLSKLGFYNNRLIVSKQFPMKRFFAEVLNADNLALLARVQNISGDCGAVYSTKDSVYIAVNGGFLGTVGKLAVLNPSNWTLEREVNFGPQAIGIFDLYGYGTDIFSINRTPFGGGSIGSMTAYNTITGNFDNTVFNHGLSNGFGTIDSIMYLVMDQGVGSINIKTREIADSMIIPDPGSANHIYIISGAVDHANGLLYANIGNRISFGINVVTNLTGDSLTSFLTGINADAIAIDYRIPVGVDQTPGGSPQVSLYPNPVSDLLKVGTTGIGNIREITIMDLTGRTVYRSAEPDKNRTIDCSSFPAGLYFLSVRADGASVTKKFIRK